MNNDDIPIGTQWVREYEKDPDFVGEGFAIDIAENLRHILKEKKMNQKQLAVNMGVSSGYITRVLSGDYADITLVDLARFAIALGLTTEIVFKEVKVDG